MSCSAVGSGRAASSRPKCSKTPPTPGSKRSPKPSCEVTARKRARSPGSPPPPGLADQAGDPVDQTQIGDAPILSTVQANWPVVAQLFYLEDGTDMTPRLYDQLAPDPEDDPEPVDEPDEEPSHPDTTPAEDVA